jgi:hypothetical protein
MSDPLETVAEMINRNMPAPGAASILMFEMGLDPDPTLEDVNRVLKS